ncbi:GNAT family N-acetyltransferase [Roseicyclus marinus]|uniref:GNAT family N-acetyltransferase n=2 Tax=Roseicyclus marinus TaxID=2161673 RepID=UPI0024E0B5B2|nr:GNAT family N-acetyltransferase [Roseicyclus marinus]MDG3041755.1 GNAT family N-acetyltransferase [Roseicyclus marinus]
MMTDFHATAATDTGTLIGTQAGYRITSVTEVTDRDALDALMLDYYGVLVEKLAAAGVPGGYTPSDLKASFWPNLHKILPPNGRFLLVHDAAGRLVGCASLQLAGVNRGELKRLYIRPQANGNGLGRMLVTAQMEAAKAMGWQTLLINIIKGNTESIRIFEALGFRYIDRYPECFDPIELDPYFVYMQSDLT